MPTFDEDGKLYFIDPIIRLKKSGRDMGVSL